ncbi:MAG: class I SAM-dependent methyltransferase [Nevskia sp.]|nr:class I SAM-dependent methyltransferase [Nevskia sp.]
MTQHTDRSPVPQPEFDAYAAEYSAGMDSPIKALLGSSADQFVDVKIRWLMNRFASLRAGGAGLRLLDYGCGTATLLRLLAPQLRGAALLGCDISTGMLDEARRVWPAGIDQPELSVQDGASTSVAAGSCDFVVISAVLHHVPVELRRDVYAEIRRVLRPGGHIVVFEHNPLNPVTRYVVARTPIDQNAILLRAREVHDALGDLGFGNIRTGYLMFAPPRLHALEGLERLFGWLPLGAQYAVTAQRSPDLPA